MEVAGEVGARGDDREEGMVKASGIKAKETGEWSDDP